MLDVVVIGGGIAGLAAAHHLQEMGRQQERPLQIRLVESSGRLGGKVSTIRRDGFLLEGGPDSFIPQKPWALELTRSLGLCDQLLASNDHQRGAFIVRNGALLSLPEGMSLLVPRSWGAFLRSPLLSWRGKLRVAGERWISARKEAGDESLASFVRRRLGEEALERLAEPLLAHIHVADIEKMSLAATYPRLAELERRHGSLARGIGKIPRPPEGDAPPLFWTLRGGMGQLIDTLADRLHPESKIVGTRALRLTPNGDAGFRVELEGEDDLLTRGLILAVPAFAAADLLRDLDPSAARELAEIRYVSMATLSLGFRRSDLQDTLGGFGFFVPRKEQRHILACTWTSTKFAHRAPEDQVLLRAFLGGAFHEHTLALDDEALVAAVLEDLERLMKIRARPTLTHLQRWNRGYPQYDVFHTDRVRSLQSSLRKGLTVAGSAFHGVGMPDCIHSGQSAAEEVLRQLSESAAG